MSLRLLWLCLVFGLLIGSIFAEEAANAETNDVHEEVEEDDAKKTTAAGVATTCVFPEYLDNKPIPTGDYVEALIGITNNAEVSYRAEYIVAYLINPNPAFYIQNYSGAVYGRTIPAGESATLKYRFKPDAQLDPRDYNLVVQVFYMNDDNETFLASAYNSTISLAEPVTTLDAQTVFSYASILGFFAVVGYFVYTKYFAGSRRSGVSAASRTAEGIDWSYVPKEHRSYVRDRSHTPKTPGSAKH